MIQTYRNRSDYAYTSTSTYEERPIKGYPIQRR